MTFEVELNDLISLETLESIMSNEKELVRKSMRLMQSHYMRNRSFYEFCFVCFVICIGSLVHGYALLTDWPNALYSSQQSQGGLGLESIFGAGLITIAIVRIVGIFVFSLDGLDFWGLLDFLEKPEFYVSTTCLAAINLLGACAHLYAVFEESSFGLASSIQFIFGVFLAGLALDTMSQCHSQGFLSKD